MFRRSAYYIFLVFVISCSESNDPENVNLDDDEMITTDQDAPSIVVNGLNSIVEIKSNLTIEITDASLTTTTIFLNSEELLSTTEANFEFTLNPYLYAVGDMVLRINSIDAEGNTIEREFPIQLKHLLMEFEFGAEEAVSKDSTWVFFNDVDGKLIEFYKPIVGMNKIYTDVIINEDFVYYTFSEFDTYGGDVIHSLINSSYKIGLGALRNMVPFDSADERDKTLKVEIRNSETSNGVPKFSANGTKYNSFIQRGSNAPLTELIDVSFASPEKIFIYSPDSDNETLFKYIYNTIDAEESKDIVLFEDDFRQMNDSIALTIPTFESRIRIRRYGYETENDLALKVRHNIYSNSLTNSFMPDSRIVYLPILDEIEFYNNNIDYRFNGKTVFIEQFGNALDANPPSWQLSDYGIEENSYYIDSGDNVGVDYYLIRNSKSSGSIGIGEVSKRFTWTYRTFENITGHSTTPILEFPTQITEELNEAFYTSEGLEIQSAIAVDFNNINEFSEVADYFTLQKLQFNVEESGYKSVQYPFEGSQSGKLDSTNDAYDLELKF